MERFASQLPSGAGPNKALQSTVPPPLRYGGTERVVHWLTEALVGMGHDVTLFATGDSHTSAKLMPMRAHAERFQRNFEVNTMALLHLARLTTPAMVAAGEGALIVTGSFVTATGNVCARMPLRVTNRTEPAGTSDTRPAG